MNFVSERAGFGHGAMIAGIGAIYQEIAVPLWNTAAKISYVSRRLFACIVAVGRAIFRLS